MIFLDRLIDRLSAHTRFILMTPCMYAIGNCSEEILFGLRRARHEGKRLIMLWPFSIGGRFRFRVANEEMFNLTSPYRQELPRAFEWTCRLLLTGLYFPMRFLSLTMGKLSGHHLPERFNFPELGREALWMPRGEAIFKWDAVERCHWTEQTQTPIEVALKPEKLARAHSERLKMGIPEGAWFVGLHVREKGFINPKEEDSCRNATIANYIPAIQEITRRGGWVVRLGDKSMTPLPPMERVIDYPFTRFKSALMDLYLISECRFYIGMASGILDTAFLFQRPLILTNMTNWTILYPRTSADVGILKHFYSKSRGRFLSAQEILEEPWEAQQYQSDIDEDYVAHETSADEIRTVVVEFMDHAGGITPSPLQMEFNLRRIVQGRRLLSEPVYPDLSVDAQHRFRIASRLESSLGFIGRDFLEKNWERDSRNSNVAAGAA
jgi:putative glycosyltransferase (TIGR04372 family)